MDGELTPEQLLGASRGSVVAAAGCGKTELLARTVERSRGRELVLTHTNAGVDAVRARLRRRGVARHRYSVETIAGFCLRYVSAYPRLAGVDVEGTNGTTDWDALNAGAHRLLERSVIKDVLCASYTGAFVDEYQDCSAAQHAFLAELAGVIPVRILGDPLQGIFTFRNQASLDWERDVEAAFPRLGSLVTPWRWRSDGNAELGAWLVAIREPLQRGQPIDLSDAPVTWRETGPDWAATVQRVCFDLARRSGSVIAVAKWRAGCEEIVKRTNGMFRIVEPVEAAEAFKALRTLEHATDATRARSLLAIAELCCTGMADIKRRMGGSSTSRTGSVNTALAALREVSRTSEAAALEAALDSLVCLPSVKIFRPELLDAIRTSVADVRSGTAPNVTHALRARRAFASRAGRPVARRAAGTTLLVKGLEFEHAVVIADGELTSKELYVALTRARQSLTIVSPTRLVTSR